MKQTNPSLKSSLVLSQPLSEVKFHSTYIDYINNYFDRTCGDEYDDMTEKDIQKSLTEVRALVREFNVLLGKMIDKSYQYLAQFTKEKQPIVPEKEIDVLKAEIENAEKVIEVQEQQKIQINSVFQEIGGKKDYQLHLLQQIHEVKEKMPSIELHSKHSIGDIHKNGYILVNQEVDQSMYIRLAILRADCERAGDRLRKVTQHNESLDEKIRQMEEKQYQIANKLEEKLQLAKQKSLDVSSNTDLQALKQKKQGLNKQMDQIHKKIALYEHVANANQNNLVKKVGDMKKLSIQYSRKTESLQKKIQEMQKKNQKALEQVRLTKKQPPQTLGFKYAENLLKSDKKPHISNNDKNFIDIGLNSSGTFAKPKMPIRYNRQRSLNEPINQKQSIQKKNNDFDFDFEDQEKNNKSSLFKIRKKMDKKQSVNLSALEISEKEADYHRISKPMMPIRKKKSIDNSLQVQSKNSEMRIEENSPKRGGWKLKKSKDDKKISDEYMRSLEQRGKKILGI